MPLGRTVTLPVDTKFGSEKDATMMNHIGYKIARTMAAIIKAMIPSMIQSEAERVRHNAPRFFLGFGAFALSPDVPIPAA